MRSTAEITSGISTTFVCHQCQQATTAPLSENASQLLCAQCRAITPVKPSIQQAQLLACPLCTCQELYWRKDFPQKLGVAIVVIGFLISCVTWYFHLLIATFAVLLAMALIDVVLFIYVGDVLECYRCHAQFRGCEYGDRHQAFDLETFEKHRQMAARTTGRSG
jgi:hypothetical protein